MKSRYARVSPVPACFNADKDRTRAANQDGVALFEDSCPAHKGIDIAAARNAALELASADVV